MIPRNLDMRFEISTLCNYDCIICPRMALSRKLTVMSSDLFKFLFDKINGEVDQYSALSFPGMGEPLMDKAILDKIIYAKSKKPSLDIHILTNGSLLTPDLFDEFEIAGVSSVRVSFYGYDNDSYDIIHRPSGKFSYDYVKDNLVKICKRKKKTKLLMTYNIVDGKNDKKIDEWIDFWKDKTDLLEVWRPHNWVDAKAYRKVQLKKIKSCGRPFYGPLQIQVDGTVNMCCFDFDGKLTLGDLKTQSLSEIFSTPICNKIVKCHDIGNFDGSKLICGNCDQRNMEKNDVMVYNSKFKIEERVKMVSTTYKKL